MEQEKNILSSKRTIREVYDVQEGVFINSDEFFSRPEAEIHHWRLALQESISLDRPRLVCSHCKQMVKLCGKKTERGVVSYFSHLHDSEDCDIKTNTNRTKEEIEAEKYGLVSESFRHKNLKEFMYTVLISQKSKLSGISDICIDRRINSTIPYLNWRCPDISFDYNGQKIVLELQLSTTFVSVIVDRDIFYRLNNFYVIWVFNFDDNMEYVNLQNLMCKDIYYANKRNVYILDEDARKKSLEESELYLTCTWLDENGNFSEKRLVTLKDFVFDRQSNKAYVYDADELYYRANPQSRNEIVKLELSRQELLIALKEKEDRKNREAMLAEQRREQAIDLLKLHGNSAEVFEKKGKFGFKADDVVLHEPMYSEVLEFDEFGYAVVKKGRSRGLVNRYGEFIIPCKYLRAMALSKSILLYVDKIKGTNYWKMIGNEVFKMEYSASDQFNYRYVNEIFSVIEVDKTSYSPYAGYFHRHIELLAYGRRTLFFNKIGKVLNADNTYEVVSLRFNIIRLTSDGNILFPTIGGTSISTNPEGLSGVVDDKQEVIIPHIYKKVKRVGKGLFSATQENGKVLVLNDSNGRIFEQEFDNVAYSYEDNYAVKMDDIWVILGKDGNALKELTEKGDIAYITNSVYLTIDTRNKRYEVYDYEGKLLTHCEKFGRLKNGKLGLTYLGRTKTIDDILNSI